MLLYYLWTLLQWNRTFLFIIPFTYVQPLTIIIYCITIFSLFYFGLTVCLSGISQKSARIPVVFQLSITEGKPFLNACLAEQYCGTIFRCLTLHYLSTARGPAVSRCVQRRHCDPSPSGCWPGLRLLRALCDGPPIGPGCAP